MSTTNITSQSRALPVAAHTPTPWKVSAGYREDGYAKISSPEHFGLAKVVIQLDGNEPFEEGEANAAFIVRACNSHGPLARAWSELAFHANELANAKTKAARDAASLKVFCAIGDAKDALPELRTLSESIAATN